VSFRYSSRSRYVRSVRGRKGTPSGGVILFPCGPGDVHLRVVHAANGLWLGGSSRVLETLTKWLRLTRLGTRTKESNMCASARVLKTLAHNESKRWESLGMHHPPVLLRMDSSQSTHDGTRKMVIYSCAW